MSETDNSNGLDFNFDKITDKPQEEPDQIRTIPRFTDIQSLKIPPKQQLISPWLTEKSITLISGWRGTGKTWFALSLIGAANSGKQFGPWKAGKPVSCLYLDGELPIEDIKERLNDLGTDTNNKNSPYIYSNDYETSKGYPRANLYNKDWCKEMKQILIYLDVKLWVIDNLASLAGGSDENTKKDWDPINSWLLDLRFAGISTIMLQNTNKAGGQRGTSAREDNIDISIILEKPSNYKQDEGCRFITKFTKNRVKTRDLYLIKDTEFSLIQNELGKSEWTHGKPKPQSTNSNKKRDIIKAISNGMVRKEIATKFNVSSSYITKISKDAEKTGFLNEKGKLTKQGEKYFSMNE